MKFFIVLNPAAGHADPSSLKQLFQERFGEIGHHYDLYETTGAEDIAAIVKEATAGDYSQVVAAGGDGTVSAVADGLAHGTTPLGILPVGTGNLVARELGIPLEPEAACQLLLESAHIRRLDGMQVGKRTYISHVSMGVYSRIAEDVAAADKKREGRLAYVRAILQEMAAFPLWRFTVEVDGRRHRYRVAMVLLANVAAVGIPPLKWGEHIYPDDGRIDVCLVRARTLGQYLKLLWFAWQGQQAQTPEIVYLTAHRQIHLQTRQHMPVRADGEVVGQSAISIEIKQGSVPVVVGPPAS